MWRRITSFLKGKSSEVLRDGTHGPQSWIINFSMPGYRRSPFNFHREKNSRIFYWKNPEYLGDELFRELIHFAVQAYIGRDLVALCDLLFWPETAIDSFFNNREQWNDLCGVEILNFEADLYLAKERGIQFETVGGRLQYLNIEITEEVDPQNFLRRILCKELTPKVGRSLLSETEAIKNHRAGFVTSTTSCCSTSNGTLVSDREHNTPIDQRNGPAKNNDIILDSQNASNLYSAVETAEPVPGTKPNAHGFSKINEGNTCAHGSSINTQRDYLSVTYSASGYDRDTMILSVSDTTRGPYTVMRMRNRTRDVGTLNSSNDKGQVTRSMSGYEERDRNRGQGSVSASWNTREPIIAMPPGSSDVSITDSLRNRTPGNYSTVSCTGGPTSSVVSISDSSSNSGPGNYSVLSFSTSCYENKDQSRETDILSARRVRNTGVPATEIISAHWCSSCGQKCLFSPESQNCSQNAVQKSGTELVTTRKAEYASSAGDKRNTESRYKIVEEKSEQNEGIDDSETLYLVETESKDVFEPSCEEGSDDDDDNKLKAAELANSARTTATGITDAVGNANSDVIIGGSGAIDISIGIDGGGSGDADGSEHNSSNSDCNYYNNTDDEDENRDIAGARSFKHGVASDGSDMIDNHKTDHSSGCVDQRQDVESALTEDEDQVRERENVQPGQFSKYVFDRLFGFRKTEKSKLGVKRKFQATVSNNRNGINEAEDFLIGAKPSKQLRKDSGYSEDECKEEMCSGGATAESSSHEYELNSNTIEIDDTDIGAYCAQSANSFEDFCPTGSCCDEEIFYDCSR